ncbi:MAG: SAM-dependent methyltransferase [Nitrospira sp. LK70]|nr:SAM-dependent methyltransferase [Nitrospira sp. LK70]
MAIAIIAKNLLPWNGYAKLRTLYRKLDAWLYRGDQFQCPICGNSFRIFKPFGADVAVARELCMVSLGHREASLCPGCASKERDRAIALYLTARKCWFRSAHRAILHIAPEEGLGHFLRMLPNVSYLSGDLYPNDAPTQAMRRIDVTQMPFESGSFDLLICSHVLEHVADDRKAMREACRILKEGGVAFLQVPYSPVLKETREDPAVMDGASRLRLFGQEDHLRLYGTDYAERLRGAGFMVMVRGVIDAFGKKEVRKNGLTPEESLFICSKGPSALTINCGAQR